jgi:dihydrodipicolinate synthase/N-acetylneuraminate lyase
MRATIARANNILSGAIPAMLTPLDDSGDTLDLARLPAMLERLVADGVNGIFAGGTMGEGVLLSTAERQALTEAVIREVRGRVPVAVHVGALSTSEAVALAEHAQAAGADAIAAVPPFYFPYDDDELEAHYAAIAAAAPALPLYLYNLPSYCRNELTPAFLARVAEKVPTVAGIKESSGKPEVLASFLDGSLGGLDIICGSDGLIQFAVERGAVGAVSSGIAVFPTVYAPLVNPDRTTSAAGPQGQAAVNALQEVLGYGAKIAAYKLCWELRGIDLGGVRRPQRGLTAAERERMSGLLRDLALVG